MGAYRIVGGSPLHGTVPIHGAKNSVLPILAATLMTRGECVLQNCPDITDLDDMLALLRCLGCRTEQSGDCVRVDTAQAVPTALPTALVGRMRAAVLLLGAMLARFGTASLAQPGGCRLGERPIDLHLRGLRLMGAECVCEGEKIKCNAAKLRGCTIALPFPSVGATENLILAALGCEGTTTLCNAAQEPEIGDLIGFLRTCGAQIAARGSVVHIVGGARLHGATYRVMPDRMEAATYLAAAAATRGRLRLCDARAAHLDAVLSLLRRGGCEIEAADREVVLRCPSLCAVGPIVTAPYDGFPTDAQAPIMAAMATAEGTTVVEETVFGDRFGHVSALRAMGAHITAAGRFAVVRGVPTLHGAQAAATDLRGGAATVIGALAASGESRVTNIEYILRGYTDFAPLLCRCGAEIQEEG